MKTNINKYEVGGVAMAKEWYVIIPSAFDRGYFVASIHEDLESALREFNYWKKQLGEEDVYLVSDDELYDFISNRDIDDDDLFFKSGGMVNKKYKAKMRIRYNFFTRIFNK